MLSERVDLETLEKASAAYSGPRRISQLKQKLLATAAALPVLLNPAHRRLPHWPKKISSEVIITSGQYSTDDAKWTEFEPNSAALPKGLSLRFEAETTAAPPYDVYWQIVNTGSEAARAQNLRGEIKPGSPDNPLCHGPETTKYSGRHAVECYIVKNGAVVAQSGQFIVNIA